MHATQLTACEPRQMLRVLCLATDPLKVTQLNEFFVEVSDGYTQHYINLIGLFV
jgi:hypothetical protein